MKYSGAKETRISQDELVQSIEGGIRGADDARLERLKLLQTVRGARGGSLGREAARMADKHGPNHPRVAEVARRKKSNELVLRGLGREIARSSLPVPQKTDGAWTVFGWVHESLEVPLPGLTVILADDKGAAVEHAGAAETGKDGAFVLRLPMEAEPKRKAADAEAKEARKLATLHLEVFRAKRRIITDSVRFTPAVSEIDYREIAIIPERNSDSLFGGRTRASRSAAKDTAASSKRARGVKRTKRTPDA